MWRAPPQGGGHEGFDDVEHIAGGPIRGVVIERRGVVIETIPRIEGILGFQGMMFDDFSDSDDSEEELYGDQRGSDSENEGEMYGGRLGGRLGINFDELESDEDELSSDDDEWDDFFTEPRGRVVFQSDVKNVEFPVSNRQLPVSLLAGRSEITRPNVDNTYEPLLTVFVVGEKLGDFSSPSAAGTVMDTKVWEALPEEVVEAVLLRLPAAAQARCRAVCMDWLSMLSSVQFLQRSFRQALSRKTPPLCAVRYSCELRRSPPETSSETPSEHVRPKAPRCKAVKMDLSFLPEVFHSNGSRFHNSSPSGFVCISLSVDEGMHVCVVNPFNHSFKVMPMLQGHWGGRLVLLMGAVTAAGSIPSFKVYVPGVRSVSSRYDYQVVKDVAVYNSINGEWKGFLGGPDVNTYNPVAVACNGDLYSTVDSTPPQLVRLSLESGPRYLWHLALPSFFKRRHWANEFYLVEYRGKLLCCCGGIWMLDDAREVWVEIAGRCPRKLLHPYFDPTYRDPPKLESVHVAGDLLVFLYGGNDPEVGYDMLRRVWVKIPRFIAVTEDVLQPMPYLRLSV